MKLLLSIIFLSILSSCLPEGRGCDQFHSKVKLIGGCDRNGDCGVILEDGTVLHDTYEPVVGAYPSGSFCYKVEQR